MALNICIFFCQLDSFRFETHFHSDSKQRKSSIQSNYSSASRRLTNCVRARVCANLEFNVISVITVFIWRLPHNCLNRIEVFAWTKINRIKGGELEVRNPPTPRPAAARLAGVIGRLSICISTHERASPLIFQSGGERWDVASLQRRLRGRRWRWILMDQFHPSVVKNKKTALPSVQGRFHHIEIAVNIQEINDERERNSGMWRVNLRLTMIDGAPACKRTSGVNLRECSALHILFHRH